MDKHVPAQQQGKQLDLREKCILATEDEARAFYTLTKNKLLNVNRWYDIATLPAATFRLMDRMANETKKTKAAQGDYVRINIPGPGPSVGNGYDWVVVEKIQEQASENTEACSITLRPAAHPLKPDQGTAHFFESAATSTLLVKRVGVEVTVSYHGRNEVVNAAAEKTADKFRNTLVGWSAKIGLSYPQWESLVKGLIKANKMTS